MSTPTKVYPIRGRWLHGVAAAVQVIATKSQADELVASGAFTDNPNHADRDGDAPELEGDPVEVERPYLPGERETEPIASDAPAGGPIDAAPAADTATRTPAKKPEVPTGTPPAGPSTDGSSSAGDDT